MMADAGKAAGGGAMGEAAPKHERAAAAMGDIGGKVRKRWHILKQPSAQTPFLPF